MNSKERSKSLIQTALAGIDSSDQNRRLAVYKAAIKATERLPDETRKSYTKQINQVILEIEQEYREISDSAADVEINATRDQAKSEAADQRYDNSLIDDSAQNEIYGASENSHVSPGLNEPPAFVEELGQSENGYVAENPIAKPGSRFFSSPIIKLGLGGALLLAAIWGISSWRLSNGSEINPTQAASTATNSDGLPKSDSVEVLVDSQFPKNIGEWKPGFKTTLSGTTAYADFIKNDKLISGSKLNLVYKDLIPVKTDDVYLMQIEFSVLSDPKTLPRIQAGVATFDKAKEMQKDKPGTHRYFVLNGRPNPNQNLKIGDKFVVSGIINDEGNETHSTFRPATKFVKPLILFRKSKLEANLAIEKVSFTKVE